MNFFPRLPDAVHAGRAEDPDDASAASRRQHGPPRVRVPAPGAGVEVLVRVGVRVALEQLVAVPHHLVDGHPVVPHCGEHNGVLVRQVVVYRNPENRVTMIFPPVSDTFIIELGIVLVLTFLLSLVGLLVILDTDILDR